MGMNLEVHIAVALALLRLEAAEKFPAGTTIHMHLGEHNG